MSSAPPRSGRGNVRRASGSHPWTLPARLLPLCLASCSNPPGQGASPPTDLGPVGDGLTMIAFALVATAVLGIIGRFLR